MSTVTSPFGALAVIVDPTAGEGRVAAEVGAVKRALAHRGLEHRIQIAEAPGDVSRLATAALDEGYRYLAAVGDDGTVQDVVNGMFRDGRTIVDSPVLAVMAAGSGCDLVRSFGLPGDVDGASSHLIGENTYELDVMKITARGRNDATEVRYAHNVAEVGLHASATAKAAGFPRWMGNGRRFVGFWAAYAGTRRTVLDVVVDGRPQQHRAWSVIVGTGQFADGAISLTLGDARTDFNPTYTKAHTVYGVAAPSTLMLPVYGHFSLPYKNAHWIVYSAMDFKNGAPVLTVSSGAHQLKLDHTVDTRHPGPQNLGHYTMHLTLCNPGCSK